MQPVPVFGAVQTLHLVCYVLVTCRVILVPVLAIAVAHYFCRFKGSEHRLELLVGGKTPVLVIMYMQERAVCLVL